MYGSAEGLPASFQSFISDPRWCDGAEWGARGPKISSFDSSGCAAYSADFAKYCYGTDDPRSGTYYNNTSEIQAGDVLVVGGILPKTGEYATHWFVCLQRNGNSLYVAEGNVAYTYNEGTPDEYTVYRVRIGWNYTIANGSYFYEDPRPIIEAYHYYDAQSPVITSALIKNRTSEGYDVTVTATDDSGVQTIGFYTWHSAMSVNDAHKQYVQAVNGKASFHVSYSSFNAPSNVEYYTNVEAFDTSGNASVIKKAVVMVDLGNDFYGYLQANGSKIVIGLLPESSSGVKKAVWHFRKQLDGDFIGSYEIASEYNGLCMDVESYAVFDGNGINLLDGVGNLAQRFYICLDEQKPYDRYFISTVLATSSLDVPGAYTDLGGTIQLWTTNYTDAQMFLINRASWTIRYDANGGTGAPSSQTKYYKSAVTISSAIPTRAYYRFLGWADSPTATTAAYAPGSTYTREGNAKLYAVWAPYEKILELPDSLERIDREALLNTDAEIIVVPETVTQIGENAFGDAVIYGKAGSAAEAYANANGLTFVPITFN